MKITSRVTTGRWFILASSLLLLAGCAESDILVGEGEETPPQVLIISRDVSEDPRGNSTEAAETFPPSADIDPMRLLWVQTYETEIDGHVYESARAGFWVATGGGSGASFEQVRLGGHDLRLLDPDCKAQPSSDDELCWVVMYEGRPLNVYAADARIGTFTDRPLFEALGSGDFADITARPEIPGSNRMVNVEPGTRIHRSRSWTIELGYPVSNPSVFIRPSSDPGDGEYTYKASSEPNVFVTVDGTVDRVVIPQPELARLYAAGVRSLWVSLYVNPAHNRVDSITLVDVGGESSVEVGVALSSFHNVWNVALDG